MVFVRNIFKTLLIILGAGVLVLVAARKDSEVRSRIWIDAPPAVVWGTLMSTTKYPSWNPFITNVKGHFVEGSVVQLQFGQPDAGAMVLTARVLTVRPDAELHWKGRVFMDGLFDGDHRITLEPRKNGTLFTQEEHFSGLLVGSLTRSIFNGTKDNFDAMDAAIKKRSEATTASELGTTRD